MTEECARRFSFFQLVQLLERAHQPAARVGHSGPLPKEIVRFRPEASLGFPRSDVVSLEQVATDRVLYQMTVTFLGLYGTVSPLPAFYTEDILHQEEQTGFKDLLDVFHHRFLSFYYRAGIKYRYQLQCDTAGNDPISRGLRSFFGLGFTELTKGSRISPIRLMRFAGLLRQRPVSAASLGTIISGFFGDVTVEIEQCTGRWVGIKSQQKASLGRFGCSLGSDSSLGSRVFSRTGSFRVALGPMEYDDYVKYLPPQENFHLLVALVEFAVLDNLEFDIELIVYEEKIPPVEVRSTEPARMGSRLGLTSWLIIRESRTAGAPRRTRSLLLPGRIGRRPVPQSGP